MTIDLIDIDPAGTIEWLRRLETSPDPLDEADRHVIGLAATLLEDYHFDRERQTVASTRYLG